MKCPVCDNVNVSMVCPKCGFDSSRDVVRYPTFGPVGRIPAPVRQKAPTPACEPDVEQRITEQSAETIPEESEDMSENIKILMLLIYYMGFLMAICGIILLAAFLMKSGESEFEGQFNGDGPVAWLWYSNAAESEEDASEVGMFGSSADLVNTL